MSAAQNGGESFFAVATEVEMAELRNICILGSDQFPKLLPTWLEIKHA